jgi:gamma-polyglutamate biosynthesis protein CapA
VNQEESIILCLIGDIFPGELSYTQNYGIRTQFEKHKGKPWLSSIKAIVNESDIVIGNLESPLVNEPNSLKGTFFGSPGFAQFLKKSNFNILNIANNHILEHGIPGFNNTLNVLKDAEIDTVGHIENSNSKIVIKHVKGLKIGVAGFSNVDLSVIRNDNCFAVLNEINVLNALQNMHMHAADLKILCFHWGNEYIHIPSLDQRKLAYKFIDNGADIIIGHHPHVIQPFERYKKGIIFYSLGNFIFDFLHSKMVSIGLVAKVNVMKNMEVVVNLSGVKLSFKNTIVLMPFSEFENYYSKITKSYEQFLGLNDDNYEIRYKSLLKRNHLWQRILMKTSIINEFFRLNKRDKKYLIKNLFSYYFRN